MEKRRIRLEINGVVCGLITQESDEYMQAMAREVGSLMADILAASPLITRESAAVTAAMSYCDDAKKNGKRCEELQERVDELEVEAEIWQEEKALLPVAGDVNAVTAQRDQLQQELVALQEKMGQQAALVKERWEEVQRERQSLVEQAAKQEAQVQALTEKLQLVEEENRLLQLSESQADAGDRAMAEELRAAQGKVETLEAQCAQLRTQEEALAQEQLLTRQLREAQDKSEAERASLAQRLQALEEEHLLLLDRQAEELTQGSTVESFDTALVEKLQDLEEENRQLKEMHAQPDPLDQAVLEKLQELEEENKSLRTQLGQTTQLDQAVLDKLSVLEEENSALRQEMARKNAIREKAARRQEGKEGAMRNPLRFDEFEQQGLVSFFEKK